MRGLHKGASKSLNWAAMKHDLTYAPSYTKSPDPSLVSGFWMRYLGLLLETRKPKETPDPNALGRARKKAPKAKIGWGYSI